MKSRLVPILAIVACSVSACADLTAPSTTDNPSSKREVAPQAATTAPSAMDRAPGTPLATAKANEETIVAAHIMVAYEGATGAKPAITRSKQEAKNRAEKALQRARAGEDFAKLAAELSDGPSAEQGGQLGRLRRDMMAPDFSNVAFALQPGAVSEVVETQFGFHVIRRSE